MTKAEETKIKTLLQDLSPEALGFLKSWIQVVKADRERAERILTEVQKRTPTGN